MNYCLMFLTNVNLFLKEIYTKKIVENLRIGSYPGGEIRVKYGRIILQIKLTAKNIL